MLSMLLLFVGVSAVVIVTPGPDTAMTIRSTLGGGRRHGVLTAAGVATGQLGWTVAAAVGLAGLVAASRPAFEVLRLVGSVYLIAVGLHSLYSALRPGPHEAASVPGAARATHRRAFAIGILNDLSNPKMAVFFLSLLPQFAPGGALVAYLGLGALFAAMTFVWLCAYAVIFDRLRRVVTGRRFRRIVDSITGTVLVGLGARLALER